MRSNGPRRPDGTIVYEDFGKTVGTTKCACCGRFTELSGTAVWWGRGGLSYLNGCREDLPCIALDASGKRADDEKKSRKDEPNAD
jgi:hypothetical protein